MLWPGLPGGQCFVESGSSWRYNLLLLFVRTPCFCYLDHRHTDYSMADSGVPQEQLLELLVQMKVIVAAILQVHLFMLITHP